MAQTPSITKTYSYVYMPFVRARSYVDERATAETQDLSGVAFYIAIFVI